MPEIVVRQATPADAAAAGVICYQAFHHINTAHNFPPDLPTPEAGIGVLTMTFSHPGFYCVVAESGGRIIGSNCLDERSPIAGVGPITVDPAAQNAGAGRMLMDAVIQRSQEREFSGVRLLQAAFHNRSLSLYTKLGFDTREPISTMTGPPLRKSMDGFHVRPALKSDLAACNGVSRKIHGHDRGGELADAIEQGTAKVVERTGRITGYTSSMAFFGHSMGETVDDLKALISAADTFGGPGILVPTRNAALFRWCLENGLRVVHPMTLMSMGMYQEPAGSYLPSVLY
jgi:GNAT superfamily N-acetyltransferase